LKLAYKMDILPTILAHALTSSLSFVKVDDAPNIHPVAFAQACSAPPSPGANFPDSYESGTVRA